jgi:hypothetical protein
VAGIEAVGDVANERWLGLVGMDAECFGRQCRLLLVGATPEFIAQSLPSMRLRIGLCSQTRVTSMQSLPEKEVDSAWEGTFFDAGFHSSG